MSDKKSVSTNNEQLTLGIEKEVKKEEPRPKKLRLNKIQKALMLQQQFLVTDSKYLLELFYLYEIYENLNQLKLKEKPKI